MGDLVRGKQHSHAFATAAVLVRRHGADLMVQSNSRHSLAEARMRVIFLALGVWLGMDCLIRPTTRYTMADSGHKQGKQALPTERNAIGVREAAFCLSVF